MAITAVCFDTIQSALDSKRGAGGWFWWNYDDGSAVWFPYTATQDDALAMVRGNGFLATWNEMEAKVNPMITMEMLERWLQVAKKAKTEAEEKNAERTDGDVTWFYVALRHQERITELETKIAARSKMIEDIALPPPAASSTPPVTAGR